IHPVSIWRKNVLTNIDYDSYEYAPSFRRAHVARHLWAHFITATISTFSSVTLRKKPLISFISTRHLTPRKITLRFFRKRTARHPPARFAPLKTLGRGIRKASAFMKN